MGCRTSSALSLHLVLSVFGVASSLRSHRAAHSDLLGPMRCTAAELRTPSRGN